MNSPRTDRPLARSPSSPVELGPRTGARVESSAGLPAVSDARHRINHLRAEAEAVAERTTKAALLYEAGYVHEVQLAQPAQAVQDYLAAYNADSRSRLPLHALVRMFERRRSYKNLARLYDAEVRSARSPAERGTALTDQATLSALVSGEEKVVQARLEQALEQEPKADPALLLEWSRRALGDEEGALRALTRRAESSDDPVHRGALLLELAEDREARGEISGALEALRAAALTPDGSEPAEEVYAIALGRFARQHHFTEELVEASERRAQRLAEELEQRRKDHESEPQLIERLRSRAVAHWYEAARLRCTHLSDPIGALRSIESALRELPGDLLFRHLRMFAYDLLEDRERAAGEARALLEAGFEGEQSATLHFRLAEHALVLGDAETARAKLIETIAVAGGSPAAEAMLDDLLLDEGRHQDRIAQREIIAEQSANQPEHGLEGALAELGQAAQIAATDLRDPEHVLRLYARADALAPRHETLLREAYGSALELDDGAIARFALERLLALELAPDERAALLVHRFELSDEAQRDLLLDEELTRPSPCAALLKLGLAHAAAKRDYARLAALHQARAQLASDSEGDDAADELCVAARAWLRASDLPRARQLLEQALERAPAQRYALTLLEEVLREQGDAAAAIALLRSAADRHQSERDAELHLLSAGAACEAAGDFDRAAQNYLEAASKPEPSLGALWALWRLGQQKRAPELERRARTGLAERERVQQRAGVDTVLLAEHFDLVDQQPERAEPLLSRALPDDDVGHHAAIALALSRTASLTLRGQALELLATRATDSLRPALLRELGGELAARGAPHHRVVDLAERVARARFDDRWAAWTRTHTGLQRHEGDHARALAGFAETTTDLQLACLARAEALWADQLAAPTRALAGGLATLEVASHELSGELAEVVLALSSPHGDGALRIAALDALTREAEVEARSGLLLQQARAHLAAGDAAGALTPIEELLHREPEQLAAWELAYAAAQQVQRPSLLADAAERLAEALEGELALDMLEESAIVRMDQLDDPAGAERLFAQVLAAAPGRKLAFQRLHDLLDRRGDLVRLTALLRRRAQRVDEPEELMRLYFELARHERRRGDLAAALDALDNVLMLDDEHLGALGLSAEIQTARGNFREAVAALDQLAAASSLPRAQRRLAALGAADFLEHKLDDREGALVRLERLLTLAPDDAGLHVRLADLAERHMQVERAAQALERAVELESDAEKRVVLSVRHADLLAGPLGRKVEAVSSYRRALEWAPDHVEAARSLLAITADDEVLVRLEHELRARTRERPRDTDLLRKLRVLAELKRDPDLGFVALAALHGLEAVEAIGALRDDERVVFSELQKSARQAQPSPDVTLSEGELRALAAPSIDGRIQQLLHAVFSSGSAAAELDQLEPARFGVGRGQRLSPRDPHALRDDLRVLAAPLGLTIGDVYVGGGDPRRIAVLPREGELGFVIGSAVESPLSGAARHAAALQLAATKLDSLPLLSRSVAEAARVVFAAMASEQCPLPSNVSRADLGDLPRTVGKALSRKARRALPELVRALPDGGAELASHCQALLARTRRLALLLSGELEAALREANRPPDAGLDLLRTWTSSAMSSSRRKLGLAL
jgi:cellulose synthase operon protein C